MEKVPETLFLHTESLAKAIRHGGIAHYQTFVRAHILEVIEQTFPHVNRHITLAEKSQCVDDFIRTHQAIEPEFHHIATEFVRFVQQHHCFSFYLLSLLEYEWVLFSISILPDRIKSSKTPIMNKNAMIELNPTLYCIELPFSIESIENNTLDFNDNKKNKSFFYGVFRNAEHKVLYKSLNLQERYLVQLLQESPAITYDALKEHASPTISTDDLTDWLTQTHLINFIHIDTQEHLL